MAFVVVNHCYGGFCFSAEAMKWLEKRGYTGDELGYDTSGKKIKRDDHLLVACVLALGTERASSQYAKLELVSYDNDKQNLIEVIDIEDGLERPIFADKCN